MACTQAVPVACLRYLRACSRKVEEWMDVQSRPRHERQVPAPPRSDNKTTHTYLARWIRLIEPDDLNLCHPVALFYNILETRLSSLQSCTRCAQHSTPRRRHAPSIQGLDANDLYRKLLRESL